MYENHHDLEVVRTGRSVFDLFWTWSTCCCKTHSHFTNAAPALMFGLFISCFFTSQYWLLSNGHLYLPPSSSIAMLNEGVTLPCMFGLLAPLDCAKINVVVVAKKYACYFYHWYLCNGINLLEGNIFITFVKCYLPLAFLSAFIRKHYLWLFVVLVWWIWFHFASETWQLQQMRSLYYSYQSSMHLLKEYASVRAKNAARSIFHSRQRHR
jgi:hypothetical protein